MPISTTAVILVAGVGSRLRPLTDDRPKALVSLGDETILGRAVRLLTKHGVTRLVLATGYRRDAVERALEGAAAVCEFIENPRYDSTQNSVSLALCGAALAGQAFYKLDGDVVFEEEVLSRLDACPAELAVAVDRGRRLDGEAMKFRLDERSPELDIEAFGKGIALEESAGESIGIERLSAGAGAVLFEELRGKLTRSELDQYYEDVYSALIAQGKLKARAVDVGDLPWTEVDTPEDLERARELVRAGT